MLGSQTMFNAPQFSSDQKATNDFRLGVLLVVPSTGEISGPAGIEQVDPKVMAVLVALAGSSGELFTRAQLLELIWPGSDVYDDALTQSIYQLRKHLSTAAGSSKYRNLVETLPKRGYRLTQPVTTLERSPVSTVTASNFSDNFRRRKVFFAGITVLTLIVVLVSYPDVSPVNKQTVTETLVSVEALEGERKSIAILPFEVLSSGEDDEYFADGLTLEISNSLAALGDLRVIGSGSTFTLKGSGLEAHESAELIGVDHFVTGSIQRSRSLVRVTVQVVEVEGLTVLWSEKFDRSIDETLVVQTEIASRIAESLGVVLVPTKLKAMEKAGLKNVDAFIEYQKGITLQIKAHGELPQISTLALANLHFDNVTELVRSYWPAHIMKIDLHTHLLLDRAAGESLSSNFDDLLESAEDNFRQVLNVSYTRARNEAESANVSVITALFLSDWGEIQKNLDTLTKFDGCLEEQWIQVPFIPFGRASEASNFFQNNIDCYPLDPVPWNNAAMANLYLGQPLKALELLDEVESKRSPNLNLQRTRFEALLASKRYEDAESLLQIFPERMRLTEQVGLYASQGLMEKAQKAADNLSKISDAFDHDPMSAPMGNLEDALVLSIAPLLGDRQSANAAAGRIDARPFGPVRLAEAVLLCLCGAPFDLEATPNFTMRIKEAKFTWPPFSPVDYPLKNW